MPTFQAPRGTADRLPAEQKYWRYIESHAMDVARRFGYGRIDSPMFEDAGLFVRGVGEGTDIVEKEMYVFEDRGGDQLTLRAEGTAPVCRAYLEHGMHNQAQPVRMYYLCPVFRYERPRQGRYRQFTQSGVELIGPEGAAADAELAALVFDSHFDTYRGVISSIRIVRGTLRAGSRVRFMQTGAIYNVQEIGVRTPSPVAVDRLGPGEVGYLISGVKNTAEARPGETVTDTARPASTPLPGYREPKPMVFCGLYPLDGDEYPELRDALDRLRLNDSSFSHAPETSPALGFGYRCGFLGLLHMEIITQRLEREFALDIIATKPSVEYRIRTAAGDELPVDSPAKMPPAGEVLAIAEPILAASIISPARYTGRLMDLCQSRRGRIKGMEYLSRERVELRYRVPLAEVVTDFYDQLKSRTRGYASLDYEPDGYEEADLVKVDILLQHEPVDAFSAIVHRDASYPYGRRVTDKLRELIPRQQYDVPIQAAIGSRIIARETVKAYRKDVTAKLYGGDVTRKRKLLAKQKAGKRRMKAIGRVEIPPEAFVSVMRMPGTGARDAR